MFVPFHARARRVRECVRFEGLHAKRLPPGTDNPAVEAGTAEMLASWPLVDTHSPAGKKDDERDWGQIDQRGDTVPRQVDKQVKSDGECGINGNSHRTLAKVIGRYCIGINLSLSPPPPPLSLSPSLTCVCVCARARACDKNKFTLRLHHYRPSSHNKLRRQSHTSSEVFQPPSQLTSLKQGKRSLRQRKAKR